MPVVNPHAAGIDVGSVEHWVCVPEDSVHQMERAWRSTSENYDDRESLSENGDISGQSKDPLAEKSILDKHES